MTNQIALLKSSVTVILSRTRRRISALIFERLRCFGVPQHDSYRIISAQQNQLPTTNRDSKSLVIRASDLIRHSSFDFRHSMLLSLWSLVLFSACIGCSHRGGNVVLTPLDHGKPIETRFAQAFVTQPGPGEYDVVLVDSAAGWESHHQKGSKPLQQAVIAPVSQMMRIHLYWRPMIGTTKNPAAINASIDWYVLGSGTSGDLIVYEGAGHVVVEGDEQVRRVRIRDGTVTRKLVRGEMKDSMGPARITGSVKAVYNDGRVKDTIAQMQQQVEGQ